MAEEENRGALSAHKVTKAEVIPWEGTTWGVRFEFDDGQVQYAHSGTREQAKRDADDRIGEEMPIGMNPLLRSAQRMEELKARRGERKD
jgi:hypothetical protein